MAAGANCFLASEFKVKLMAPNPTTERGVATVINAHPKENKIIYPSGKYIVVRNLDDPGNSFIYRGHAHPTTVSKFSPNGFWVASGDSAGKVRVWSWDHPEHLLKIEISAFSGPVQDLDWDHEAKKIVAVGEGGQFLAKCFVWDTGNSAGEMVGHTKKVVSCSYRKSRPFKIMTGGMDFGTVFYAGPPFKMDHSNNVHTNFVNCVRYSPDGSKIVSVGSDRKIQLYDGTTGQPASEVADAHAGSIYSVCFSPDNSKFVTASGDKTLKIWNAQSLACELTLEPAPDSSVAEMQLSVLWTDLYIISLSLNGNINLFRPDNPQPVKSIEGHQVSISSLCYDPVSNSIYTGSLDGVVCVSNPDTAETMKLIPQDKKTISKNSHGGKVSGIICSGEEVISIGWDDSIRFANPTTREYIESIATNGQPIAISGSNIPGVYAVITNAELSLYNGRNVVASLTKLPYSGTCISLYGDSEVAVGGDDSKTHLYSVANGTFTEITTIPTRSPVSSVAYSPTGDFIAIGDNGRQVEVYERGTWAVKVQGIWVFHTSKITALAWSPSGSHLASGSLDESIFVWDMSTPKKKIQYQFAHMSGVSGLSWLSSNKLVSCGNDQTVVTWNVAIE